MSNGQSFLASLNALSDDELSDILANSPDMIRRAQKALADAKRKAADAAQEQANLAKVSGQLFDLKAWQKAKRLVTGPYNPVNLLEIQALFKLTHPAGAPVGERSLLCESLDYLASKAQVVLDWPHALVEEGAEFGEPEAFSCMELFCKRSMGELGPNAYPFFLNFFNQDAPWAEREASLSKALLKSKDSGFVKDCSSGLIAFFKKLAFDQCYSREVDATSQGNRWTAISMLVAAGCNPPAKFKNALNPVWEQLIGVHASQAAAESKISAFAALIKKGWIDEGTSVFSDNLRLGKEATVYGALLKNCGSRSIVQHCAADASVEGIFAAMCEREEAIGFARYDGLGRSRLYFINERLRGNRGAEEATQLLSMARLAIELGDPPESVNAQNPLAKAASADMATTLSVEIERRDLGSTIAGASVSTATRKRSSL